MEKLAICGPRHIVGTTQTDFDLEKGRYASHKIRSCYLKIMRGGIRSLVDRPSNVVMIRGTKIETE